ncbi:MAG: PQQ-like beta-propeller repeat protein [Proteobacteria bacterium]|nr:PQQ-like beta-propeller repeat protein [Pseudomonadota bacterium]
MEMQKLVLAFVLAFGVFACSVSGKCKVGDDAGCPVDTVCYGGEGAKPGVDGICTEGEFSSGLKLVGAVKGWRLSTEPVGEVVPLLWDKREIGKGGVALENAEAGWVGKKSAVVEVEVVGLKSGELLRVWTGQGKEAVCEAQGAAEGSRAKRWACIFEEGWAGTGPEVETVEVRLKAGVEADEHVRTYRVDVQAPLVDLVVSAGTSCSGDRPCPGGQSCKPLNGSAQGYCADATGATTVRVCAHVRDTQSGVQETDRKNPPFVSLNPTDEPLKIKKWDYEEGGETAWCWLGSWPADEDIHAYYFGMTIKARDKLGNEFYSGTYGDERASLFGNFERLSCSTQVEGLGFNAVKAPLVFSNGRLLFGTSVGAGATAENNALYVVDAEDCSLSSSLHTGAIEGPMVALGGSGRVAIASGEGGPKRREGPRLSLIEAGEGKLEFAYGGDWDCVPGMNGIHGGAAFDKGLSLVSVGEASGADGATVWRLAAPANSMEEKANRLVAYAPNAIPLWRCITKVVDKNDGEIEQSGDRFMLTPVQFANYDLVTTHATGIDGWLFHDALTCLHWGQWDIPPSNAPTTSSNIAVGKITYPNGEPDEPLWFSGAGLKNSLLENPLFERMLVDARQHTSSVVVDSRGWAYVAASTDYSAPGSAYTMQRFSTSCSSNAECEQVCVGVNNKLSTAGLCRYSSDHAFKETPVGSPLLGEPMGANRAEIYVVGVEGTVLALDAETLQPLWAQSLGIRVLPTAQPVLVANKHGSGTLWVVGASGEVRGIRVKSAGLSRAAAWPKAFHDNCNTGSAAVTSADLPKCF